MLHAVLLSLLVADAVAMSTVHMMWRNEGSILAEGLESVAAYNVSQVLNSLEGYPSNDYNVSIDSVYVKTSADVPLVWHDCEGRLEHGINSTTVTVTGSYPHAGANVSLQGLLPNGTLCIKASGTPYRVSLDVDVYLRFEPKSWAAPMTTTVLSDSFVTSFMANKEKMAWDIRGTFAIEEAAHDYAAVLRCTETGTVRFQLRLYYESWFVVRDHRGVMHSAQYFSGAQHVAKNVTCVQGSNLYVAGWWNPAYPQSSVSWEFTPTSSTPRTATPTPTPAPHKLDSDPTSTSTETSCSDGVSIGVVFGLLGVAIVEAVVVGLAVYWFFSSKRAKAVPRNADMPLTDEEGCSGGGGGGTIRHSSKGSSAGASRGVGGGGKGGRVGPPAVQELVR